MSVELIHVNSKQNQQPRVMMKTSLKAQIKSSPMKASALTEQLVQHLVLLNTPDEEGGAGVHLSLLPLPGAVAGAEAHPLT